MKPTFGMMITDGRNKLGTSIYSHNQYGAYVKAYFKPHNPKTVIQQTWRSFMSTITKGWPLLTEAQRQLWITAAARTTMTGARGYKSTPTGIQLYTQVNLYLILGGFATTLIPLRRIQPFTFPPITLAASATLNTLTLLYATALPNSLQHFTIEITPMISAGKYRVTSTCRYIAALPASGQSSDSLSALYIAKYGSLVAGKKIIARVKAISNSGTPGIPITVSCIISA